MEIWWPSYFADPARVPPMPAMRTSVPAYAGISAEMLDGLQDVAARLADGRCPYGVLAGAASPIPWGQAARATEHPSTSQRTLSSAWQKDSRPCNSIRWAAISSGSWSIHVVSPAGMPSPYDAD